MSLCIDITELTDNELNWIWCGVITQLGLSRQWTRNDITTEANRRGWNTTPNRETRRAIERWYREGLIRLQDIYEREARGGGGSS